VPMEYLDPKLKQNYAAFVEDTFGEQARQLGWLPKSGDTEDQQLLRPQLVRFVAISGRDPALISEAKRLANAWLADRKAVPPDVAGSVLAVAARFGDAQFYDKVLAAAKAETDPTFKPTLIGTLGQFSDPQLLNRSIALAFNGPFDIRMSGGIVFSMLREPSTAEIAYRYVREHYDQIKSKLPQAVDQDFAAFFPILASASTCSDQGESEARSFFEPRMKQVVGGPRQLANSLEQIHLCSVAKPTAEKQIAGFLGKYSAGAAQSGR
jgi:cytosol alanyl aminopeptidase